MMGSEKKSYHLNLPDTHFETLKTLKHMLWYSKSLVNLLYQKKKKKKLGQSGKR